MKKSIMPVCYANQIKISYKIRRTKTYLHGARPIYDFLMKIWDKELIELQCQYVAVFLDIDRVVLGYRCITTSTYARRHLDTGLVIAIAASTRAHYIIIAHNNPSGDLIDEAEDRKLYTSMLELSQYLGCQLQDQMIISYYGYYSFAEKDGKYIRE